jgi:hypothetical protein
MEAVNRATRVGTVLTRFAPPDLLPQSGIARSSAQASAEIGSLLSLLRDAGSGRYLAAGRGRDPATVSRWPQDWAEDGTIARERQGKAKRALTVVA